ncbi:MAG: radical SAM protein [Planctomycetota bacterium]
MNRVIGEPAPCRLGADAYVFKRYVSFGDEPELVPTYRVYLSGCNFRCTFCNTGSGCFEPTRGERVDPVELATELTERVADGVKTIDLLGGEPSLHVHTLLELAAASAKPLPLALDSNMYMAPEVLEWLDGVIALYIADFKFGNDECAKRLAGVARYVEVVTRNLRIAAERTPMIIRHLLMPGHVDCCFRPVVDWTAEHLPGARFQLHTGYVPCWRATSDAKMSRLTSADEMRWAWDYLQTKDLQIGPE